MSRQMPAELAEILTEVLPPDMDPAHLSRHYTSATLASPAARAGWQRPDLAPFPWPDA